MKEWRAAFLTFIVVVTVIVTVAFGSAFEWGNRPFGDYHWPCTAEIPEGGDALYLCEADFRDREKWIQHREEWNGFLRNQKLGGRYRFMLVWPDGRQSGVTQPILIDGPTHLVFVYEGTNAP